jgi:uncharacterized damage-inducible protein DinB
MDPLSEAFQHHLWATETLGRHLRTLPPEALELTAPGVYGGILATLSARGERPELAHATNLLFAQALHHGTDHRSQICTALSANGYEVPDIDVWSYWRARRMG